MIRPVLTFRFLTAVACLAATHVPLTRLLADCCGAGSPSGGGGIASSSGGGSASGESAAPPCG